jgi:hypothetical protein
LRFGRFQLVSCVKPAPSTDPELQDGSADVSEATAAMI